MKWKIGNVKIANQIVLAPMAGITDSVFRQIVKEMGCGLVESEMISTNAIIHNNKKTSEMLHMSECERPISVQIFGSEAESFKIASKYIYDEIKPEIIDINMGCPVNKVAVKSNSGSALLKDLEKVSEITNSTVSSVSTPVTVKIRSGWNSSENIIEIAKTIEDAGASAITIHPRTREEGYGIKADWSIIKNIKNNVSIPVIGNGDIWTCYDAKRMLDETNCDAVMIGRGALGNPWLIKECIDYLDSGKHPQKITIDERISMIKKHCELLVKNKGEKMAMKKMRTHAAYYLKNQYRSVEIKPKIFKMNTKNELFDLLDKYREKIRR